MSEKHCCLWKKIRRILRIIDEEEERKKFPELSRGSLTYRDRVSYLIEDCVLYLTEGLPVSARLTRGEVATIREWLEKE